MVEPSVSTSSPARGNRVRLSLNQDTWSLLTIGATLFTVAAITGITAAVSYEHEYQLAHRHLQAPWVSSLLPFTVDGMILGASVVLFWAASNGISGFRQLWRPMAWLAVGIGATIAANLAAGLNAGLLGAAVSAWAGISLILISDLAMWLMSMIRALANGEDLQPVVACTCPKPATVLADALLAARAELKRQAKPAGEQALADNFGVTRHQVRTALAAPGDTPETDPSPTPVNGRTPETAQA